MAGKTKTNPKPLAKSYLETDTKCFARVYLLCGLFNLDPLYWTWQLQIDGGGRLRLRLSTGEAIRLGPAGGPKPTPSCYRAAALLMLATRGNDDPKALWLAEQAGVSENDLRETWAGMQIEFADEIRAIERLVDGWKRDPKHDPKLFQWPRDIRGVVAVGYLAHQIQGAWPLQVVDPVEIAKFDAAKKPHPAAVAVLH